MTPRLRKLALSAHVTTSVGWLGTVASFQALAIADVTSRDPGAVRGFYLAMELIGWYVIVPLCLASLVTGLVVSLGAPWGLIRHYWVLAKFLITGVSALILLRFTQTLSSLGDTRAVSATPWSAPTPSRPPGHLGDLTRWLGSSVSSFCFWSCTLFGVARVAIESPT